MLGARGLKLGPDNFPTTTQYSGGILLGYLIPGLPNSSIFCPPNFCIAIGHQQTELLWDNQDMGGGREESHFWVSCHPPPQTNSISQYFIIYFHISTLFQIWGLLSRREGSCMRKLKWGLVGLGPSEQGCTVKRVRTLWEGLMRTVVWGDSQSKLSIPLQVNCQ